MKGFVCLYCFCGDEESAATRRALGKFVMFAYLVGFIYIVELLLTKTTHRFLQFVSCC